MARFGNFLRRKHDGGVPIDTPRGFLPRWLSVKRYNKPFTPPILKPNVPSLDSLSGALVAIGVRKLRTAHPGNAFRLRRESDNAESDFGFNAQGGLDVAAINAWRGSSRAFLTTLYDQSGNVHRYSNPTAAAQALFVPASKKTGRPCFQFVGSQVYFVNTPVSSVASDYAFLSVLRPMRVTGLGMVFWSDNNTTNRIDITTYSPDNGDISYAVGPVANPFLTTNVRSTFKWQALSWILRATNLGQIRRNGVVLAQNLTYAQAPILTPSRIGRHRIIVDQFWVGEFSEFIIFTTIPSSSDLLKIEKEQTDYYNIRN